jgi:segregation and condensation protein A
MKVGMILTMQSETLSSPSLVIDPVEQASPSSFQPSLMKSEPLAIVRREELREIPKDLYIPPEYLRVILEAFEGPLDLLLYLIRKHDIDIMDIPIAQITDQYVQYIKLMHDLDVNIASDYLVMSATLAEIKSHVLLPRPKTADDDEPDPRIDLVARLQEYERFKKAAEQLNQLPQMERDIFVACAQLSKAIEKRIEPDVSFDSILSALKGIMMRAKVNTHHVIRFEALSIRERMTSVLNILQRKIKCSFSEFLKPKEGRMGVAVTTIAILELSKNGIVKIKQSEPYAPILVETRQNHDHS